MDATACASMQFPFEKHRPILKRIDTKLLIARQGPENGDNFEKGHTGNLF
jgi:hypothetical protein